MKCLTLALVALLAAPTAAVAQSALEIEDVVQLLQLGGSRQATADVIQRSCIAFPLDAAAGTRLRAAGADDAMIAVLNDACFAGAELVVESAPAGAEVLVDDQRVGATPYTARFARGRSVALSVRSGEATLGADVSLEPGERTRAVFAFPQERVPVPLVRSVVEVSNDLNLAQRWRPVSPQPAEPSRPGDYGGFLALLVNVGAAASGAMYCADAEHYCYVDPIIEDDGTDSMEPLRYLTGAVGGALVGMTANAIIGKFVNSVRGSSYERAVAQRADWQRRNEVARAEWIANHPDLREERSAEETARDRAIARNIEIDASNQALQTVSVTTERLAGPAER